MNKRNISTLFQEAIDDADAENVFDRIRAIVGDILDQCFSEPKQLGLRSLASCTINAKPVAGSVSERELLIILKGTNLDGEDVVAFGKSDSAATLFGQLALDVQTDSIEWRADRKPTEKRTNLLDRLSKLPKD
jgi:hypothetical protein